jgi:uncharacterized membrane protein
MHGPIILGFVGAAIVLFAMVLNLCIVRADSPRYKLDQIDTYDGGAEVKLMVQDLGRINVLLMLGAALQFAALMWQSFSS